MNGSLSTKIAFTSRGWLVLFLRVWNKFIFTAEFLCLPLRWRDRLAACKLVFVLQFGCIAGDWLAKLTFDLKECGISPSSSLGCQLWDMPQRWWCGGGISIPRICASDRAKNAEIRRKCSRLRMPKRTITSHPSFCPYSVARCMAKVSALWITSETSWCSLRVRTLRHG